MILGTRSAQDSRSFLLRLDSNESYAHILFCAVFANRSNASSATTTHTQSRFVPLLHHVCSGCQTDKPRHLQRRLGTSAKTGNRLLPSRPCQQWVSGENQPTESRPFVGDFPDAGLTIQSVESILLHALFSHIASYLSPSAAPSFSGTPCWVFLVLE